jgi:CubicO group peptidase (beta-lactamase class C family)
MIMSKIILPIALACIFLVPINTFAESSKPVIQKIDTIVNKAHQLMGFNGSVTIANTEGVIYQNAFGFADQDNKIKLTTEHLLSTGSISKEFSTVGLIMLEEEGKIHYNDKVSMYLTNLPAWGNNITIEQLLSHTSGLPQIEWSLNLDTAAVEKQLMSIKSLAFVPGTDYLYGNLNVLLRAWIIEKITNKPFTDFVKEKLFIPAKMTSIFNKVDLSDVRPSVVVGDYTSAILGVSYFTTPYDLYLWEKSLMNNQFINKASIQKALTPHTLSGMSSRAYFDLGNFVKDDKGEMTLLLHDGSNPDHHAIKANHLNKELIMILMSSDGRKMTLFELNNYIADLEKYNNNEIPASWWLSNEIKQSNFIEAFGKFKTAINEGDSLIVSEDALNKLGYSFARNKELDNAIEVMKLNTELYPNSANTYDSYAELLVHTKKYKKALPVIQEGLKLANKESNTELIKFLNGHLITVNKNL